MINIHSIKLKIFTAIALATAFIIAALLFRVTPLLINHEISHAEKYQNGMAKNLANSIDLSFQNAARELESIAALPDIISLDKDLLDKKLTELNRTNQFFESFFVLDTSGTWISHPKRPQLEGRSIPEKNMHWVQNTFAKGHTISLDVVPTLANSLVTGLSTPIRSKNNEIIGLLRGVIVITEENALHSLIDTSAADQNVYAYLVSANGQLIAHPYIHQNKEDILSYTFETYEPVTLVTRGQTGQMEYEYDSKTWLASFMPIPFTGWGIIVQQPLEEIITHADESISVVIKLCIITAILCYLLISGILKYTLGPLSNLVRDINKGKISRQAPYPKDEVGQLTREFARLYAELYALNQELAVHKANLEQTVDTRTEKLHKTSGSLKKEICRRTKDFTLHIRAEIQCAATAGF